MKYTEEIIKNHFINLLLPLLPELKEAVKKDYKSKAFIKGDDSDTYYHCFACFDVIDNPHFIELRRAGKAAQFNCELQIPAYDDDYNLSSLNIVVDDYKIEILFIINGEGITEDSIHALGVHKSK